MASLAHCQRVGVAALEETEVAAVLWEKRVPLASLILVVLPMAGKVV